MRVLLAAPKTLLPVESGRELRVLNLLRPLCTRHEFSLICFTPDRPLDEEVEKELDSLFPRVELVAPGKVERETRNILGKIHDWISPSSVLFGDIRASATMGRAIRSHLERYEYDVVCIASPFMLNYFLGVNQVPIVFDAIDDTSLLFRREIKRSSGLLNKLRAVKDWLIIRRVEGRLYSRFKEITLTSPIDAQVMKSLCPDSNVTVIPNGVDARYFDATYAKSDKPTLVFTGVMDYGPNAAAMTFFCRSIFPIVTRELPDVQLLIVGRNPTTEVLNMGKSIAGVQVTGSVEDIRPYIGQSWLYVCPLISGAGIKNKVLEAWSARVPIVATSLSCEGIDVSPGEDILVADTAEEFAKAIISVLKDENLAKSLADNGRQKVLKHYDWESKANMMEEVLQRAVADFRS